MNILLFVAIDNLMTKKLQIWCNNDIMGTWCLYRSAERLGSADGRFCWFPLDSKCAHVQLVKQFMSWSDAFYTVHPLQLPYTLNTLITFAVGLTHWPEFAGWSARWRTKLRHSRSTVHLNPLWHRSATWRQRPISTLVHVMVWCLMAPNHYLNQCWPIIINLYWHSSFDYICKIWKNFLGGQWVLCTRLVHFYGLGVSVPVSINHIITMTW